MFKDIRGMPICDEDFGNETLASEYVEISPGEFAPACKDTALTVQVDEDFGEEGCTSEDSGGRVAKSNGVTVQINEDASGEDLRDAENAYRRRALIKEAAPIIIAQAEQLKEAQKERIKVEVKEVLSEDVDRRLNKFEKRRRRVKFREHIGKLVKWGIIAAVALTVYAAPPLRNRAALIWQDAVEMAKDLAEGREVSSNKLLQDMFSPIDWKGGMQDGQPGMVQYKQGV